jgi:hypothetical protein
MLKEHLKNIEIFWNIEKTFKKYANIWMFFQYLKNNIEEKNLVFYKYSFNILNKIWNFAPCVNHHASDILCQKFCNLSPGDGSAPNLVIIEYDNNGRPYAKRAFNT